MKINNNITAARPISQTKQKNPPNFKGRILNDKNLKRIGDTAIFTSLAGQGIAFGTGVQNSFLLCMNSILGCLGLSAQTARLFIKDRDLLKLKPEIIFNKSKTLEQAANFAKENFKIKDFNVDNLDTANWINEGLTRLSNRFKGKTFMPDRIELVNFPQKYCKEGKITGGQYHYQDNSLLFNKSIYTHIDRDLKETLDDIPQELLYLPLGANKKSFSLPYLIEIYKQNPRSFSSAEKTSLLSVIIKKYELLKEIADNTDKADKISKEILAKDKTNFTDAFCNVNYNPYDYLDHEMGHLFDFNSNSLIQKFIAEIRGKKIFEKEKENMILPQLAGSSFQEFNAEIFSGIINGDKYPKYIMEIFKKLNNIKLPD